MSEDSTSGHSPDETESAEARYEREHGQAAWEERYTAGPSNHQGRHGHVWSGRANPTLIAETAHLSPSTALDAGAGEGGDACWLAQQGWQVTAVDLAPTALGRGRARAAELGLEIDWRHLDLTREGVTRDGRPQSFDLVTAHYLHAPLPQRLRMFEHLAAAVAPGGTLLVVGHDRSDLETSMPRPGLAEACWTAAEVAESLGADWTIEVAEARPRSSIDPDGAEVTVHDSVLRARRDQP